MGTYLTPAYLAPASPCELNIDHHVRGELISYINEILADDQDAATRAEIVPGVGNSLHASQLQNLLYLYEKIQAHIFRLMATDSVPKFVKTERFLSLMASVFQFNEGDTAGLAPKPHKEDMGRAYLTVSQAANEKQAHGLVNA